MLCRMRAGYTKNTRRRKPRSSSWLGSGFAHDSQPQGPRHQKREERFVSYCLFYVAPDATLFNMFPLQAGRVLASQCCLIVSWPFGSPRFKGEGRDYLKADALTLNPSPLSSPLEQGKRPQEIWPAELTIPEWYACCRLKHSMRTRHFACD